MSDEFIAVRVVGNERSKFYVFDHNLFNPRTKGEDVVQRVDAGLAVNNNVFLLADQVIFNYRHHSKKGRFGCIGDVGEDSVLEVKIDGPQDLRYQQPAQLFSFLIDFRVCSAGEINSFKATRGFIQGFKDAVLRIFPAFGNDQGISRFDFLDLTVVDIKGGLDS